MPPPEPANPPVEDILRFWDEPSLVLSPGAIQIGGASFVFNSWNYFSKYNSDSLNLTCAVVADALRRVHKRRFAQGSNPELGPKVCAFMIFAAKVVAGEAPLGKFVFVNANAGLAGIGGSNLRTQLLRFVPPDWTHFRIISAFPLNRSFSQTGDEYVYRSNCCATSLIDDQKFNKGWQKNIAAHGFVTDGVKVNHGALSTFLKNGGYNIAFSLNNTSPVPCLPAYNLKNPNEWKTPYRQGLIEVYGEFIPQPAKPVNHNRGSRSRGLVRDDPSTDPAWMPLTDPIATGLPQTPGFSHGATTEPNALANLTDVANVLFDASRVKPSAGTIQLTGNPQVEGVMAPTRVRACWQSCPLNILRQFVKK